MKGKMYIVSWNGISNAGGVERVTQYLYDIWKDIFDISIVDYDFMRENSNMGKLLKKHHIIDGIISSKVVRKIQRNEPDAKIVVQGFNCPFVKANLAIAHGTMRGYQIALKNGNHKWHINQLYEKSGFRKARKIMAVGGHVKKELVELYGVASHKITVIENCVDTDIFYPIEREKDDVCHLIFSGRIEYGKGMHYLKDLAELIEKTDGFDLTIATNNACNTELFKNFTHTRIIVGLNRNELNAFYNKGSVMIFPSLYEGFGLVTPECLAAGVPVLGYDVGAVSDLKSEGTLGVEILSKSLSECLNQAQKMSNLFTKYEKRLDLHKEMENKYGYEAYRNRLINIWKE